MTGKNSRRHYNFTREGKKMKVKRLLAYWISQYDYFHCSLARCV